MPENLSKNGPRPLLQVDGRRFVAESRPHGFAVGGAIDPHQACIDRRHIDALGTVRRWALGYGHSRQRRGREGGGFPETSVLES